MYRSTLILRVAVLVFLIVVTFELADEPMDAGKLGSATREAHFKWMSCMPWANAFSASGQSDVHCTLNWDFALSKYQAAEPLHSAGPEATVHDFVVFFDSIENMRDWIQALTGCVVVFSAYLSWRTARIARSTVQVDVFQKLRTAYILLRPKMPRRFWAQQKLPDNYEQLCAMESYWYQSYDEWYVTQILHPKTLGRLWKTYYRDSILENRHSPVMIAALIHTSQETKAKYYGRFFRVVVYRWWRIGKIRTYEDAEQLSKNWDTHMAANAPPSGPAV